MKTGQSRGSGLFCLYSEHKCNKARTFLKIKSTVLTGARSLARAGRAGIDLGSYPRMGKLKISSPHRHPPASASYVAGRSFGKWDRGLASLEGVRGGQAGPGQGMEEGDGKRRKGAVAAGLGPAMEPRAALP